MLNKNTMEVTRKIRKGNRTWVYDIDDMEVELRHNRKSLLQRALVFSHLLLNDAYDWLGMAPSREGLTMGWDFDLTMKPEDLFTWTFRADHEVDVTFHNLKDVSNLYKTEEELA